ncbi:hypothetical protein C2S51_009796 [Perilla frutescens var. frutescens]|nr:hypothetical protein C2S51_009796 [Perilla frutescens var. frutescens]
MQCAYDQRGNSTPTILLRMQNHLYSEGGLRNEFSESMLRIVKKNMLGTSSTKESSLVELMYTVYQVRLRLGLENCHQGYLILEQVMHCNTGEECSELVKLLPPTEAALLDCAINLMADAASTNIITR